MRSVQENTINETKMSSSANQTLDDDVLMTLFKKRALGFKSTRDINLKMLVAFGTRKGIVCFSHGSVTEVNESSTPLQAWDFSVTGSTEGWNKFWQDTPEAGWHDIFALTKRGEVNISGQLQPFMAHLQVIKDLLAIGRGSAT